MNEEHAETPVISSRKLIELYKEMGIPHFQRGQVWGVENVSLLLESLYFGTPCGSIILWEPFAPLQQGVPLADSQHVKFMIIDGQQRIRSIYDAIGWMVSDGILSITEQYDDEQEEGGVEEQKEWCVNLSRIPGLELSEEGAIRHPMFHLTNVERFKRIFIPLKWFNENRIDEIMSRTPSGIGRDQIQKICDKIHKMPGREVFMLKIFKETPESYQLSEVVSLYNRINSAGKRVEAEEKAYATIVSINPAAGEWLGKLFASVHKSCESSEFERDEVMKRRKERNFGFKLFIRVFVQVCSYHFNYSIGSASFSFDVVNSPLFLNNIKKDPKETMTLFERTGQIIEFVGRIVKENLFCDDLQMLPETTSLMPLFQFLIRYPGVMEEKNKPAIASLALRSLLSRTLSQKVFYLVKIINDTDTAQECMETLFTEISKIDNKAIGLKRRLEDADSLLDPYTLLLYWILRKRGAVDFSYKNLGAEQKGGLWHLSNPKKLEEEVEPEKQHIVPYSKLQSLYDIEKRGRVRRHECNNIGNITYISRDLNHYETGLSDHPIKLELEPDENLKRHFLYDDIGDLYKRIIEIIDNDDTKSKMECKKLFERFCQRRSNLIAEEFNLWLQESATLSSGKHIKPDPRRVNPMPIDIILKSGYPEELKDSLCSLISNQNFNFKFQQEIFKSKTKYWQGLSIKLADNWNEILVSSPYGYSIIQDARNIPASGDALGAIIDLIKKINEQPKNIFVKSDKRDETSFFSPLMALDRQYFKKLRKILEEKHGAWLNSFNHEKLNSFRLNQEKQTDYTFTSSYLDFYYDPKSNLVIEVALERDKDVSSLFLGIWCRNKTKRTRKTNQNFIDLIRRKEIMKHAKNGGMEIVNDGWGLNLQAVTTQGFLNESDKTINEHIATNLILDQFERSRPVMEEILKS